MDKLRTILHADMDAFYAAIEQRDRPELRGKPVIVGGDGRRSVVSTCSYEARRYGIHSAMPGTRARQLCPNGIFVRPRMDVYSQVSETIQSIFRQYTPLVEPLALDEAFMDVSGSSHLYGDGETIARSVRREVLNATGLTVSVGVAPCKYVAKVASDLEKPNGLVVVPEGSVMEFLAPLSVSHLWGAGKGMQTFLGEHGVRTIGDIQRCSLQELKGLLGESSGIHFYNMSLGADDRPVVSDHIAKSISNEHTFVEDLTGWEQCKNVLIKLSDLVGRRMRKDHRHGRTVRIKVRYGDFKTLNRQIGVPPTDSDFVIRKTALALFNATWDSTTGIRLLGVAVDNLVQPGEPVQCELFDDEGDKPESRILDAIDKIKDRYGRGSIRHGGSYLKPQK
ncbi:MAG: DNA polymerase IV [Gemmatimonadota bacterium]|nr:DNA polymerase IV [Gemmatimonadota bacterium]